MHNNFLVQYVDDNCCVKIHKRVEWVNEVFTFLSRCGPRLCFIENEFQHFPFPSPADCNCICSLQNKLPATFSHSGPIVSACNVEMCFFLLCLPARTTFVIVLTFKDSFCYRVDLQHHSCCICFQEYCSCCVS